VYVASALIKRGADHADDLMMRFGLEFRDGDIQPHDSAEQLQNQLEAEQVV